MILGDTSGAYIGRAISAGIRHKKRAPFQAPAEARMRKAIGQMYENTPGAINPLQPGHASRSRNGMFEVRYLLASGEHVEHREGSQAIQRGESVRVQLWEWTRLPKSWWQTDDGKNDDGERHMRAEKIVAMTAREFERHAR